jgi:hypothetical protein
MDAEIRAELQALGLSDDELAKIEARIQEDK